MSILEKGRNLPSSLPLPACPASVGAVEVGRIGGGGKEEFEPREIVDIRY